MKYKIQSIILLCLVMASCHHREIYYYGASTMLPGTTKDMKTPGFWISKIQNPDKILLDENQIKDFNIYIIKRSETVRDISSYENIVKGDDIKNEILKSLDYLRNKNLYILTNKDLIKATAKYYNDILLNMDTVNIPDEINVKFGIINHFSSQRVIPTYDQINPTHEGLFFDEVQMSGLDVGTPAVIFHESLDKNWFFIRSPIATYGWVEKKYINLCGKEELDLYINAKDFVISIEPKTEIFLDKENTLYYDYIKMGSKLPCKNVDNSDAIEILLPSCGENNNFKIISGFVKKNRVKAGYIPYTQKNVIEQAFKLLNAPYGWGDMYGEQDCSRFLCQIFASFGIILPRNSWPQANSGDILGEFNKETPVEEKIAVIKQKGIPGLTLLRRNGHIMLYLGLYNDKPYVIHVPWTYAKKIGLKEKIFLINKTVVTDLFLLDENTKAGPPIKRINIITNVLPPGIQ